MIDFEHVSFTYPEAGQPSLSNISFHVNQGELVLVAGPSGSGKSTLLRCLNGLTPFFSGGSLSGNIRVARINPISAAPQAMSRIVGFVFQDPEAQFIVDRVEDEIAFGMENAGISRAEMHARVDEVLRLLHLEHLRSRRLTTLSGGERQRVALASALILHPQVLALDEPTSQLDPESADDVLRAVKSLKERLGLTVIISEHRIERILPFCDHLIYIENGRLAANGEPSRTALTIDLDTPLAALARKMKWDKMPLSVPEAQAMLTANRKFNVRSPIPAATAPLHQDEAVLQTQSASVKFGQTQALQSVDFSLYPGEIVALLGPNGAGKSTLLRCLVGLQRLDHGRVRLHSDSQWYDVSSLGVARVCRQVAFLPQDPNAMLFADTAEEELWQTLHNHNILTPEIQPIEWLNTLGVGDKARMYPRDLSVGERQRVALGAVMVPGPRVILLDEPTRGLDIGAKRSLAGLLRQQRDAGIAIMVITHDVELAAQLADRVVLMQAGKILDQGIPQRILSQYHEFSPLAARIFPGSGWISVDNIPR